MCGWRPLTAFEALAPCHSALVTLFVQVADGDILDGGQGYREPNYAEASEEVHLDVAIGRDVGCQTPEVQLGYSRAVLCHLRNVRYSPSGRWKPSRYAFPTCVFKILGGYQC